MIHVNYWSTLEKLESLQIKKNQALGNISEVRSIEQEMLNFLSNDFMEFMADARIKHEQQRKEREKILSDGYKKMSCIGRGCKRDSVRIDRGPGHFGIKPISIHVPGCPNEGMDI